MPHLFSQKFHAFIDYPVALGLIVMPYLLGFSGLALGLSVATGVAAFVLTVLTDHETGVIRVLPYKLHLVVDGLVGAAFVAAPFILGFQGLVMAYYLILGATVLVVVGMHKPTSQAGTPAE